MPSMSRLQIAVAQIQSARSYTLSLLEDFGQQDWFRPSAGKATHIAWQVGHLAVAQYGLCLFRIRGRQPGDSRLMPSRFRKQFGKGSVAVADPAAYPAPDEILQVLHAVDAQAKKELAQCPDSVLDEPVDEPYAAWPIKFGALLFCAHHEMLHAGQIGLLRRSLGYEPVR